MEVLQFGHTLLQIAAVVLGLIALLVLGAIALKDRRLVLAARTAFHAVTILVLGSSATLVYGFVVGCYDNEYIFGYSDRDLTLAFKVAGLWAGLDGSLLFWTLVLAACCSVTAIQHVWSSRHPTGRRLEPYVYLVLSAVLGFFVALVIKENPFAVMEPSERILRAGHFNIPIDAQGSLENGRGLNPQLVNYWFVIHPPCLYLGLVIFTVPFAFGLAALISGELGDYWIRITRRWSMVAWLFLTCGIILGGLWAYRQLGWGGYWAWDPVENASFLPWLAATAFLHSIMIQERRDMLKWWNVFLLLFTFFLTIEATYMTRSGEVDSVHSFAGGDIGIWFRVFKWGLLGISLFLLFFRFWDLRGANRLESLFSREAAFFANNLVLVTLAVCVWFLSWLPNLSSSYLAVKKTFEPRDFNLYMVPLLAVLIFLTAVGPGLGWVKTTGRAFRKNFLLPGALSAAALVGVYAIWLAVGLIEDWTHVFVPKPIAELFLEIDSPSLYWPVGLYPTGLFLFLSFLILTTIGAEFWRGILARVKFRREDWLTAFLSLITRDNRRYGGYVVHIGLAILTIGITVSAMFQEEREVTVRIGEGARIGPYVVTPVEANRPYTELLDAVGKIRARTHRVEDFNAGLPYLLDKVRFQITLVDDDSSGLPKAHGASSADGGEPSSEARLVGELHPERRYYPKQEQWINEVSIERRLLEDIYIYYRGRFEDDRVTLIMFRNPFMWLLYIGWVTMIVGGVFAIVPFSGARVGLSE